jgi:hypothetical protein
MTMEIHRIICKNSFVPPLFPLLVPVVYRQPVVVVFQSYVKGSTLGWYQQYGEALVAPTCTHTQDAGRRTGIQHVATISVQ